VDAELLESVPEVLLHRWALIESWTPISRLLQPAATSRRTSASRRGTLPF
jgi:hypothetical protein